MQAEIPFIYQNQLTPNMQAPPMRGLYDDRALASVFGQPHVGLYAPDSVRQKNHTLPNVPQGPTVMGLGQVVYDDQPMYDRLASTAGPVRAFFRALLYQQRMVRQS